MAATQIRPGFIHYKVGCCPVGAATSSRPFLLPTPHSPVGAPICSRPFLFPTPQYPVGAPIGSRPFLLPTPNSRFLIGSGSSFCQVGSSFGNSPYSMPLLVMSGTSVGRCESGGQSAENLEDADNLVDGTGEGNSF